MHSAGEEVLHVISYYDGAIGRLFPTNVPAIMWHQYNLVSIVLCTRSLAFLIGITVRLGSREMEGC